MYKITEKVALNPTVTKMVIEAPLIAKKAKPGQFIIVRPFEDSERIPLTVAGYDREAGTVEIIFQIVGGTTMELNSLNVGDKRPRLCGPAGPCHRGGRPEEGVAWWARRGLRHCPAHCQGTARSGLCGAQRHRLPQQDLLILEGRVQGLQRRAAHHDR